MPLVYLVQPAELVGTTPSRFKVGSCENLQELTQLFDEGSRTIFVRECDQAEALSNVIKEVFEEDYVRITSDYFEGPEDDVTDSFDDMVHAFIKKQREIKTKPNIPSELSTDLKAQEITLEKILEYFPCYLYVTRDSYTFRNSNRKTIDEAPISGSLVGSTFDRTKIADEYLADRYGTIRHLLNTLDEMIDGRTCMNANDTTDLLLLDMNQLVYD